MPIKRTFLWASSTSIFQHHSVYTFKSCVYEKRCTSMIFHENQTIQQFEVMFMHSWLMCTIFFSVSFSSISFIQEEKASVNPHIHHFWYQTSLSSEIRLTCLGGGVWADPLLISVDTMVGELKSDVVFRLLGVDLCGLFETTTWPRGWRPPSRMWLELGCPDEICPRMLRFELLPDCRLYTRWCIWASYE